MLMNLQLNNFLVTPLSEATLFPLSLFYMVLMPPGGGGGVLGLIFAGYVPLTSQSLYPIIVYSVASYRPHLSHFWANM